MTDPMYAINILDGLVCAISYSREEDHMLNLYDKLIKRFKNHNVMFTDDGNIVYSTMVMLYGDYGTSPRTGWFYDENIPQRCAEFLTSLMNNMRGAENG